jgi:RNA polymerase sigma factor (sigma-70 family)
MLTMDHDEARRAWFRREILPLEAALFSFGRRLSRGNVAEAEDLVQETFVKLISYPGWREVYDPSGLSFRTLRNIAIDALRRRKIVRIDALTEINILSMRDYRPSPEDEIVDRDEFKALWQCVADLPPQCRRVFTLRKVYALKPQEIAVRLNLSVSTVEKHLAKGLRICAERLARQGNERPKIRSGRQWDVNGVSTPKR